MSAIPTRLTPGLPGQIWAKLRDDRSARIGVVNRLGQDVFARAVRSTGVAFSVGGVVAALAIVLGTALGALAGWRAGGWADDVIGWLMGVLDSLPFYLFVAALAFAMRGHPWAMQLSMIATFWTATARLVRAEASVPVFTDHWRTAIRVAYYAKFEAGAGYYHGADDRGRMDRASLPDDSRIGYLQWFGSAAEVPESLVILDEEAMRDLRRLAATGRTYAGNDIPAWVLTPPPQWTLEFEGAGLRVYRTP